MSARRQSGRVRISKDFREVLDKFAPRNQDGELLPEHFIEFPIEHNRENRKLARIVANRFPDGKVLADLWQMLQSRGQTTEAIQVRRLWQMQQVSQSFLEQTKNMQFPR